MEFLIREEIHASQYDDRTIQDFWNVTGTILCKVRTMSPFWVALLVVGCCWFLTNVPHFLKADIEGLPEVTIALTWPEGGSVGATVTHIAVDTRVQPADIVTTRKLCFTPPLARFPLCTYITAGLQHLPLRGFYQMKVPLDCSLLQEQILSKHFHMATIGAWWWGTTGENSGTAKASWKRE